MQDQPYHPMLHKQPYHSMQHHSLLQPRQQPQAFLSRQPPHHLVLLPPQSQGGGKWSDVCRRVMLMNLFLMLLPFRSRSLARSLCLPLLLARSRSLPLSLALSRYIGAEIYEVDIWRQVLVERVARAVGDMETPKISLARFGQGDLALFMPCGTLPLSCPPSLCVLACMCVGVCRRARGV